MPRGPEPRDYLELFHRYVDEGRELWPDPDGAADERHALLFEQVARLIVTPSPFNLTLPAPFQRTAQRWLADDEEVRHHMNRPGNRSMMLADLYDYVDLASRTDRGKARG